MRPERVPPAQDEGVTLAAKVALLGSAAAYRPRPAAVARWETHMSWVFGAGDRVYKLKKPVRLPFLDFSTIARREAACRAELAVNRALAPDVYLGMAPLTRGTAGLAIDGDGPTVDWLIVMRRLDPRFMLDRAHRAGTLAPQRLNRLADTLADFYRHTERVPISPVRYLAEWRARLADNRHVLLDHRLPLDAVTAMAVDRTQRRFLALAAPTLARRAAERRIVDGHGDLRPEHIFVGEPIAIIDRLEFSRRFRTVDPLDEVASLAVECDQIGQREAGDAIAARVLRRLGDRPPPMLAAFYRCYRASLRARLAITHLHDRDCRTPEKWPPLAHGFLTLAMADARIIAAFLDARARRQRR